MSVMDLTMRIEAVLVQKGWELMTNATTVQAIVGQMKQELQHLRTGLETIETYVTALLEENAALHAENKRLRALLAQEDVDVDDVPGQAGGDGDAGVIAQFRPKTAWLSSPMQRPPREGMLFSNGGPYHGRDGHATLKRELNKWTRAHGYSVRVLRSNNASRGCVKLTIGCNHARRPREQGTTIATEATTWRAGTENNQLPDPQPWSHMQRGTTVGRYRTSHARDCPLRFMLLQLEPGSGTFVVQHTRTGNTMSQRCSHEPDHAITAALEPEDISEEAAE